MAHFRATLRNVRTKNGRIRRTSQTHSTQGQRVATREEAKSQRREQIADAARTLMRSGDTGFTMRRLAETAGVSIATPYNLFGSKQAVMFAVLESDLAHFTALVVSQDVDELELFFRAVTLATEHYARDPEYHRTVLFAAYTDGGREYRSLFAGPGHALWRDMVQRAVDAGFLDRALAPNACATTLEQLLFSCVLGWVQGQLSLEELLLRAHYGFALVLLGVARPGHRATLKGRMTELQRRLGRLWRTQRAAQLSSLAPEREGAPGRRRA